MIRIEVSDDSLLEAIEEKAAGWLTDAKAKTAAALAAGKVGDGDGTWSRIKEVFILLQKFKCIYCEFPMPKVDEGSANKVTVDYDVEHYRPKNRVTAWPTQEALERRPQIAAYQASVFSGVSGGYLRLAFDPFNYVVSCKVCNSSYKADRFPIAGQPEPKSRRRLTLDSKEKPLLLFPFGEHGDDPGGSLSFDGPMIRILPELETGYEHLRARVLVDFFELDTREGLLEGRCWMIQLLWPRLEEQSSPDPVKKARSQKFLNAVQQEHALPHVACGRAFIRLYSQDHARAEAWYEAAVQYTASKDPTLFKALG